MSELTIRALGAADWESVRDIRLLALKSERGMFCSSYELESEYLPERWQADLADFIDRARDRRVFGLFDAAELIGITGVWTWKDDPTAQTAIFGWSYIKPAYRGRGLTAHLYRARLDWVAARPHFKRIVVSHRKSNESSRRAIQRFGFVPIGDVDRLWPDGIEETECLYELTTLGRTQSP